MLDQNLILVIYFISIAGINKLLYSYDNSKDKRKKIDSFSSFIYVQKYLRLSTLIVAIFSIYSNHALLYEIPEISYTFLGSSLCALSVVLLFVARFNLSDNYSPCYNMKAPNDFIQHGLYKVIRHPIYLSNLILVLGVFLVSGSIWIILNFAILFIYYFLSALKEEKYLTKKFPRYKKYQTNTSMFIPGYKMIKK